MFIVDKLKNLIKRRHYYVSKSSINWYGNDYGGFFLDQALLNSSTNLLSFGVGEDISFDLAVTKENIQNIYLFDPTPKAIEFIKKTPIPQNFQFYPVGISEEDHYADFFLPRNEQHVSGSLLIHKKLDSQKKIRVQLKRLSTIMREIGISKIDILKIDIEGSEYDVLKNIILERIFPKQICVEFHNNFYRNGKRKFKQVLNILKENKYEIGAISKSGKEYLFILSSK